MIVGFLGTGAISEAIIRGLCDKANYSDRILISQRSPERSTKLAGDYDQVEVVGENALLVEKSDWVIVAVLPDQVEATLGKLTFRSDQKVISLAAGISLARLSEWVFPCAKVSRAIPMPPIEFGLGPVALCPQDQSIETLFGRIGTAVSVSDEEQFNLFGAASALMADYFDQVATVSSWMESHAMEPGTAARYTTSLYHALASLTLGQAPEDLQSMSAECLTPGGLNEQFLTTCTDSGSRDTLKAGLDDVLARLESGPGNST
jgi:pyrroline-5-carboxylate reductase